jgi:NTE family protein
MQTADVVLEGGGVKGIALVGALNVLQENGYEFHRVAGTSAGSIVGALLAAGMPGERMKELIGSVDYHSFQDKGFEDHLLIGRIFSLLWEHGIYEGEYLREWLTEQLEGLGVRTFADLRLEDAGSDLEPGRDSRLVVMASDISTGRLRRLPWDYPSLGLVPDETPVADAVRASMSIPFFFEPVRLQAAASKDKIWLVDGGMLSNFPIEVFDRTDGMVPRWPTFGLKLSARRPDEDAPRYQVKSTADMIKAMVGTMTSFHDRLHIDDESVIARTIFIDTMNVKATDFDLDRATADRLYANGRDAAQRFLETWDFEAYVERYRTVALPASRPSVEATTVTPERTTGAPT